HHGERTQILFLFHRFFPLLRRILHPAVPFRESGSQKVATIPPHRYCLPSALVHVRVRRILHSAIPFQESDPRTAATVPPRRRPDQFQTCRPSFLAFNLSLAAGDFVQNRPPVEQES